MIMAQMTDSLATWAFALQGALRNVVQSAVPGEVHRWPLLRAFEAEGYSWRSSHIVFVLRDSMAQFPMMGALVPMVEEVDAPVEPPSMENIKAWIDFMAQRFKLRAQDAAVVIPAAGAGVNAKDDFDKWSESDKQLWHLQVRAIINRQYEHLVVQSVAQKEQLEGAAKQLRQRARRGRLVELHAELSGLTEAQDVTPQARGKQFENWLGELFALYDLAPSLNVVNQGEQIDFTFWKGDLFVMGEARWRSTNVDAPQVRDFFGKLRERPAFAVGLMISMSSFTQPALDYLSRFSGERTVLTLHREELERVLQEKPEFTEWLGQSLRRRLEHPNQ